LRIYEICGHYFAGIIELIFDGRHFSDPRGDDASLTPARVNGSAR
jgi:hypothetical protein